jgi:hypothetical protein
VKAVLGSKPDKNPGPPRWWLCMRPAPSPCKTLTARNAQQKNAGLINGGRQRQVKRNKRETIQIGSWNVLTMLKPGRLQEIAEQILNIILQIVALQEIRWKGFGHINRKRLIYTSITIVTLKNLKENLRTH